MPSYDLAVIVTPICVVVIILVVGVVVLVIFIVQRQKIYQLQVTNKYAFLTLSKLGVRFRFKRRAYSIRGVDK